MEIKSAKIEKDENGKPVAKFEIEVEEVPQLPTVDEAGAVAVSISENIKPALNVQEQALFVAGFQECIKWLSGTISTAKEEVSEVEYLAISTSGTTSNTIGHDALISRLNLYGKEGWECVGFYERSAILKRAKTSYVKCL